MSDEVDLNSDYDGEGVPSMQLSIRLQRGYTHWEWFVFDDNASPEDNIMASGRGWDYNEACRAALEAFDKLHAAD